MSSTEPAAKRMKVDASEAKKVDPKEDANDPVEKALQEIDDCQTEIDTLNEKASEEILVVEQKYNKLRKPFFEKRNECILKIENFWLTAFVNHPQIASLLTDDEEDCLGYMSKLEVEEHEDVKSGYKLKFYFEKNPYFDNDVLCKEFRVEQAGDTTSKATPIKWLKDMNLVQRHKEEMAKNSKKVKKPISNRNTFFTWFTDDNDPTGDMISEIIKDDLWANPLQYFLIPDVEVENIGEEESGEEGGLNGEEGESDEEAEYEEVEDEIGEEECGDEEEEGEAETDSKKKG